MIKIIAVGNIKETYLTDGIKEYQKRLSKYTNLKLIEVKEEISLEKEQQSIMKHIKGKDNIVVLDINGKNYSSEEFSKFINNELTLNSNITFIIGSSEGLHNNIKNLTNKKISFSKMTFPHQLFRLLLLEQIYRGFKIINNETYHK